MKIAQIERTVLTEYPNHISSIIYTRGCNMNCKHCFNPELQALRPFKNIYFKNVSQYFSNYIDAITISGGEPLIQRDIVQFIKRLKKLGYLVKLNTNGSVPNKLEYLLQNNLVDYVSMSIKGDYISYDYLTNTRKSFYLFDKSISSIITYAKMYDFNMVIYYDQQLQRYNLLEEDIEWIGQNMLYKAKNIHIVQYFGNKFTIAEDSVLNRYKTILSKYCENVSIRNN